MIEKQLIAKGARADQEEADKKIIADFGISKAELHRAYIKEIDELQRKVKSMTEVKDLMELQQKAQAKKDADEYIGNKVGITKPAQEPDMYQAHKWKQISRKPIPGHKKSRSKSGIIDTLGNLANKDNEKL